MTLSEGNLLAKVTLDKDGNPVLVTGEAQHLFAVESIGYKTWEQDYSTNLKVRLSVVK